MTPKTHQDYLSTFSLSRSTDMVIRVMTEVKIREDEYNLLKVFSSRVQGLSHSNGLATRERRLLYSGPLTLMLENSSVPSDASNQPVHSQQKTDSKRASRASKLMDVVNISSSVYEKTGSGRSGSFAIPGTSSSSGPSTTATPAKSSWFSRLPLRKKALAKSPLPPEDSANNRIDVPPFPLASQRSVSVHAFVFSDLVLLAHSCQTTGRKVDWILCEDLGVFNPLSIARIQDRNQGTYLTVLSSSRSYSCRFIDGTL